MQVELSHFWDQLKLHHEFNVCLFFFPFDFRPKGSWVWMTASLWKVQWYFWTGSAVQMLDSSK